MAEITEQDARHPYNCVCYSCYWSYVDDVATEAIESRHGGDPDRFIDETADGTSWVIYTHAAAQTLLHSQNESAAFDSLGSDALSGCESYGEVVSRLAYFAIRADIEEAYRDKLDELDDEEE